MKAHFEIVKLVVLESPDKKSLENPGGEQVLERLGGKGAGLPFMAILDPNGKVLINANEKDGKSGNVGYPVAPNEIAHFMKMVKDTAPRMSEADRGKLRQWLLDNAPKR